MIMKRLPRYPTRSCRKKIGPGEAILIHRVIKITMGNQRGKLSKMQITSSTRFQRGLPATWAISFPGDGCGSFPPADTGGSQSGAPFGNRKANANASFGGTESRHTRGLRERNFCPTVWVGHIYILSIYRV